MFHSENIVILTIKLNLKKMNVISTLDNPKRVDMLLTNKPNQTKPNFQT